MKNTAAPTVEIHIAALQKLLDSAVASGEETGCQLAVYHHGRLVADLAAGRDVTTDTLFPIFSVGKGIMATAFHRLVEKKQIDYDDRVADFWPEFAANGKADVRVWQILSHRAGLHTLPAPDTDALLADWPEMCRRMAAAAPAWQPGTRCAYCGITYAWLLGELAGRAAGRDFRTVVTEEVLRPLGVEKQFFFGTAAPFAPLDASRFADTPWTAGFIGNPALAHGFIPSANGIATAAAIARHYAALIGEVDGIRLLKPETVARATRLCRAADDPLNGTWARFGLGYVLAGPDPESTRIFGHGGAAGAEGFADPVTGLAIGFTKNKLTPTHPVHPLRDRISAELGLPIRHW